MEVHRHQLTHPEQVPELQLGGAPPWWSKPPPLNYQTANLVPQLFPKSSRDALWSHVSSTTVYLIYLHVTPCKANVLWKFILLFFFFSKNSYFQQCYYVYMCLLSSLTAFDVNCWQFTLSVTLSTDTLSNDDNKKTALLGIETNQNHAVKKIS